MSIHLLSIGTNYTGESCELPDCELDATNIASDFEPFVSSSKCLLGKKATRPKIVAAVRKMFDHSRKGDLCLCYFSGHGTTDTIKRKTVQAIVCDGLELIYDFELRQELAKRPAGVMVASLADCCHSGGLPRGRNHGSPRTVNISHCFKRDVDVPSRDVKRPNATYTACRAGEVAYSTGGGGAMTNAFREAFAEREVSTTLQAIHKAVQKLLPSAEWNQHPMFWSDNAMKKRTLKSFVGAA